MEQPNQDSGAGTPVATPPAQEGGFLGKVNLDSPASPSKEGDSLVVPGEPTGDPTEKPKTEEVEAKPEAEKPAEGKPPAVAEPPKVEPQTWDVRGKKVSGDELRNLLTESSNEGLKNFRELESTRSDLKLARQAHMEIDLKHLELSIPKERSKEEIEKMSTYEQIEYANQRRDSGKALETRKEEYKQLEAEIKQDETDLIGIVRNQTQTMSTDADKWPGFVQMSESGLINEAKSSFPFVTGEKHTMEALYYLAKGMQARRDEVSASKATQAATDSAVKVSEGAAAASGGTGNPSQQGAPVATPDADDVNAQIMSAVPGNIWER